MNDVETNLSSLVPELIERNRDLEAKLKGKDLLTNAYSSVMHDIKNLAFALKYLDEQKDYVGVGVAIAKLSQTANNFGTFKSLHSGSYEVLKEDFNLKQMVQESSDIYLATADNVGYKLDFSQTNMYSDKTLVEFILGNYLSNAAKHAVAGSSLDISFNGSLLQVTNKGQDVGEKIIDDLFKRDFTTKNGNAKNGSGIGLHNVWLAANALEAKVGVKNNIGYGPTFYVDFNSDSK